MFIPPELRESFWRLMAICGSQRSPKDMASVSAEELIRMAEDAYVRIDLAMKLGVLKDTAEFSPADYDAARTHPALPLLEHAAATYKERRASYGPSEQRFADIAMSMFPEGLTLRTRNDWVRYGIFHQLISKLARYTKDFFTPHIDSIHDIQPYAAMLEAEDRRVLNQPPFDGR